MKVLAPEGKKSWKFAGLSIYSGLLILTFYSAVIGWILYYIYIAITELPSNPEQAQKVFISLLTENAETQIVCHAISMAAIFYIILNGVTKGIQMANKVLMPVLLFILLVMFVYSLTLSSTDGTSPMLQSLAFMFNPDFSKLSTQAVLIAVGHAFFTLSIGMGSILTYAAYSDNKETQVFNSALWIVFLDTMIALVAGAAMFAILYSVGSKPGAGPGLVFMSLPIAFYELGGFGNILAVLFFIALAFAGITSAISIVEPTVSNLEKGQKMPRLKATSIVCSLAFLVGILTILSNVKGFDWLVFGKTAFFDVLDIFTSAIALPLGGLLLALFLAYVVDKKGIQDFLYKNGFNDKLWFYWIYSLKFIVPIGIVLVLVSEIYDKIIKKFVG